MSGGVREQPVVSDSPSHGRGHWFIPVAATTRNPCSTGVSARFRIFDRVSRCVGVRLVSVRGPDPSQLDALSPHARAGRHTRRRTAIRGKIENAFVRGLRVIPSFSTTRSSLRVVGPVSVMCPGLPDRLGTGRARSLRDVSDMGLVLVLRRQPCVGRLRRTYEGSTAAGFLG